MQMSVIDVIQYFQSMLDIFWFVKQREKSICIDVFYENIYVPLFQLTSLENDEHLRILLKIIVHVWRQLQIFAYYETIRNILRCMRITKKLQNTSF